MLLTLGFVCFTRPLHAAHLRLSQNLERKNAGKASKTSDFDRKDGDSPEDNTAHVAVASTGTSQLGLGIPEQQAWMKIVTITVAAVFIASGLLQVGDRNTNSPKK